MLRRRILASAMASVMALGSVAVVANAGDETATNALKTKAELKALVDSYEGVRNKDIYEKGTISAERFLGALEYAENVLADPNAGAKEWTAAYRMVESLANMDCYSAAQLAELVAKWQGVYDSQNILNEEIGDAKYTEASYNAFVEKFEKAKRFVNSDDTRIITDTYMELEDVVKGLTEKASVTKGEFRTAIKAFEAIFAKEKDYDTWRRGMKGDARLTYKEIYDTTVAKYPAVKLMYDKFDQLKSTNKTTNEDITAAYKACNDAVADFNAWTVDTTTRANKAKVAALLNQYHAELVAKYKSTAAENLFTAIAVAAGKDVAPGANWTDAGNKFHSAALKSPAKMYIPVDDNNFYDSTKPISDKPIDGVKQIVVAERGDILKFINVTSADVAHDGEYLIETAANTYSIKELMEIAEAYTAAGDNVPAGFLGNNVNGLDTINQVKESKGSVTEWTLIYRALDYVLGDMFNGTANNNASKTLKELQDEINRAYELAEKTGDVALFNVEHMAVVEARKDAINEIADFKAGLINSIDGVYGVLKAANDTLENRLNAYKYSYGEIRDEMYAISQDIDNGAIKDVAKIEDLLRDVAKKLSILDASELENQAFTKAREFLPINRLKTAKDPVTGTEPNGYEKDLTAAFEALKTAVAEDKKAAEVVKGDVDGDGKPTAADATEILKAVIGLRDAVSVEVGDMNGDGAVNAADATAILKAVIGL